MKKIKLLLVAVFSIYAFSGVNMAYASFVIKPVANPEPANAWKYIKVSEFVKLSAKDYMKLTGKKLNFFQRMSFNLTKIKMKHDLKSNPDLKITDYVKAGGTNFQIDVLWLILGFIIIGVPLAYITHAENYRITSAWIGLGLFVLGAILFWGSIF